MRSLLVLQLIACLMLCPIRCADGSGCVRDEAVSAPSCEDCCSHRTAGNHADDADKDEASREDVSEPECVATAASGTEDSRPCDDCSCLTCICNGAILESQAGSALSGTLTAEMFAVVDVSFLREPSNSFAPRFEDKPLVQRFCSGRQCRIELQSFLI